MKRLIDTAPRFRLNLRTVLGLNGSSLPNWDQVRAAQVRDLRRVLPVIWAINLFNAIALAAILWNTVSHWEVAVWLAALIGLVGMAMLSALGGGLATREVGPGALASSAIRACVCGAIWAVPPIIFATSGEIEQQVAICLVLGGMMASAPLTLSAVPLTMTCLMVPMAIGLVVMMARTGSGVLTFLPALYALSLLIGGFAAGRTALRRRWAELALEHEAGLVSLLLREFGEHDADWLWEIDVRKRLIDVTSRLAEAFARPVAKLNERPLIALLARGWIGHSEHPPELRALLDRLDARQSFADHVLPVMIDGDRRWWRLSAAPRYTDDGVFAGFRGVGSDVTEQHRSLERIDRLARADSLTEIDNRMAFEEKLRAALQHASDGDPCALMLIDLDRFKAVNDTYGHPVGDRLLRAVAGRLASLIGPADTCGRLGGDEFAMLLADARDLTRIDTLGRQVSRALALPYEIDGNVLHIGASIGITLAPRDGTTVESLMRNADLALYRVKHGGRGAHQYFVPELLDRAERRIAIEQALRLALERGEFRLVYQPIVVVTDGALVGFEALLRWDHPELGEIGPEEFVPIAGGARLMSPIGDWVLHTACHEATRWPAGIRLSINLSADQVLDPGLPMAVRAAMALSGLSPARLELEIAESTLLARGPDLGVAIERIRATGAGLALDDFGTGFGCIRQAPFRTIKISRTFLNTDESDDPESIALVSALVTMADLLGVVTIAKGAETHAQHALVRQLGCSQVQGYASGGPLTPADAFALAMARADRPALPQRQVA